MKPWSLELPFLFSRWSLRLIAVAVRIWVGYDEEDNVKVDIIYPASENAITDDNDGPTDNELGILEVLAYDNAHLLDKDVPSFAQIFYTQLQGLSPHSSLIDPLWDSWTEAKETATQEAARYKMHALLYPNSLISSETFGAQKFAFRVFCPKPNVMWSWPSFLI